MSLFRGGKTCLEVITTRSGLSGRCSLMVYVDEIGTGVASRGCDGGSGSMSCEVAVLAMVLVE